MAHVLSLTDGTTTITLTTTNYYLAAYTPGSPRFDNRSGMYKDVTESIDLLVYSTSTTDIQTKINNIENMLARAQRLQRIGHGTDSVYLQFRLDGESQTWRSEVLRGAVDVSLEGIGAWVNKNIPIRISITRRHFWEDTTLQTAGSGTVGNDGGVVAFSGLSGTEPAPAKIELTNNTGGSLGYRYIFMSNLTSGTPANFDHHQGIDQAYSLGTDASQSITYTIDANTNSEGRGRFFNVITSLSGITSQVIMVKARVMDNTGLVTLFETDEVEVASQRLTNVGAVPIPPGGDYTSWLSTYVRLDFRSVGAGTSGNVEVMHLQPSENLRFIEQKGLLIPNGDVIVDDQIEGVTYSEGSDIYVTRGKLMLWPGESQRIYFMGLRDGRL